MKRALRATFGAMELTCPECGVKLTSRPIENRAGQAIFEVTHPGKCPGKSRQDKKDPGTSDGDLHYD